MRELFVKALTPSHLYHSFFGAQQDEQLQFEAVAAILWGIIRFDVQFVPEPNVVD